MTQQAIVELKTLGARAALVKAICNNGYELQKLGERLSSFSSNLPDEVFSHIISEANKILVEIEQLNTALSTV